MQHGAGRPWLNPQATCSRWTSACSHAGAWLTVCTAWCDAKPGPAAAFAHPHEHEHECADTQHVLAAGRGLGAHSMSALVRKYPSAYSVSEGCDAASPLTAGYSSSWKASRGPPARLADRAATVARLPPALSPATAMRRGSMPSACAFCATHCTAATASSTAAGNGCSAAQKTRVDVSARRQPRLLYPILKISALPYVTTGNMCCMTAIPDAARRKSMCRGAA